MFTVVLLSPAAKGIFERSRVFFEPFIKSGQIAFCEWRYASRSTNLTEVVPGLTEAIRGKLTWRAVVVDHPRGGSDLRLRDPENPFDYIENTRIELNLKDSPHPGIRLANMLLGYPDITAKAFEKWVRYTDIETGEPRTLSARELGTEDEASFNAEMGRLSAEHKDVKVVFSEISYSEEEKALHRELESRYRMKETRPTEVVFVATRSPVENDPGKELRKVWHDGGALQPSRFIERNDYPPLCRFAVYELLEEESSAYEQDELRLWLSVLTLATNLMPPSGFQADRLYHLGVEFSDPTLGETLNEHLSILSTGLGIVDSVMEQKPAETSVEVSELMEAAPVPVTFDNLGGQELRVGTTGYRLASDKPRDEWSTWVREVGHLEREGPRFMGRPRRALARAVGQMHRELAAQPPTTDRLNDIDSEELDEALSKELLFLTSPVMRGALGRSRLDDLIQGRSRSISRHIGTRLKRRTILLALLTVVGVWLIGLLPYLIQAYHKGAGVLAGAGTLMLIVVAVMAATILITLLIMRYQLVAKLRRVNLALRAFVTQVHRDALSFGNYLGRFVMYRRERGRLLTSEAIKQHDQEDKAKLKKLRRKIVATMDAEKAIITSLGQPLRVTKRLHDHDDFDPRSESDVLGLFRLPMGERSAEFNDSGDWIRAPYDFIERLTLETVAITEPTRAGTEDDGHE